MFIAIGVSTYNILVKVYIRDVYEYIDICLRWECSVTTHTFSCKNHHNITCMVRSGRRRVVMIVVCVLGVVSLRNMRSWRRRPALLARNRPGATLQWFSGSRSKIGDLAA